jgi:hypothetical protein
LSGTALPAFKSGPNFAQRIRRCGEVENLKSLFAEFLEQDCQLFVCSAPAIRNRALAAPVSAIS